MRFLYRKECQGLISYTHLIFIPCYREERQRQIGVYMFVFV